VEFGKNRRDAETQREERDFWSSRDGEGEGWAIAKNTLERKFCDRSSGIHLYWTVE
jgi:hypothetical protein